MSHIEKWTSQERKEKEVWGIDETIQVIGKREWDCVHIGHQPLKSCSKEEHKRTSSKRMTWIGKQIWSIQ